MRGMEEEGRGSEESGLNGWRGSGTQGVGRPAGQYARGLRGERVTLRRSADTMCYGHTAAVLTGSSRKIDSAPRPCRE